MEIPAQGITASGMLSRNRESKMEIPAEFFRQSRAAALTARELTGRRSYGRVQ